MKYHRFFHFDREELMVYPIPSGIGENKRIRKGLISNKTKIISDRKLIKTGEYIGCIYNKEVEYGIVDEYCEEFDNFRVNFLHSSVSSERNTYYYPFNKDSRALPGHHIVFNKMSSLKKRQQNSIYFSQKKNL